MEILVKSKISTTPVYDIYWQFATERQNVFFNRLQGRKAPWTSDPIIGKYKFTNAYRALDRVSQYLISNIIKPDIENGLSNNDKIFRILLFKLFNKIETWQLLDKSVNNISWTHYSFREYDKVLSAALNNGITIYSAAYIMASGKSTFRYNRKHQNHLMLLSKMLMDGIAGRIVDCNSMRKLYNVLMSYPLIGAFLAYQFATDINYSDLTDFSEEEFVKAGPGAQDGITKCFSDSGKYSSEDIIRHMMDIQDIEFDRLSLNFKTLFGRPLKLIDCQNIFCEVGKYARVSHPAIKDKSGRVRIKQVYSTSGDIPVPSFPEKWGLSSAIQNFLDSNESWNDTQEQK